MINHGHHGSINRSSLPVPRARSPEFDEAEIEVALEPVLKEMLGQDWSSGAESGDSWPIEPTRIGLEPAE